MSIFKRFRGYCPHPPLENPNQYPFNYNTSTLSLQIRDFGSSLDALVGVAILYGLLFLVSFIALPNAGVEEEYQLALLRAGSAIVVSLAFIYLYARFRGIWFLRPEISKVKWSILQSFLAILVWAGFWLLFGALSNTYTMKFDSERFAAAPFSLMLGFLGGLVVYGYCAPKFQEGVGKLLGVILSSSVGALLFLVVSIDYSFSFLPLVVLLVYIGMQTESPVGPIVFTALLFGLLYALPVAPALMDSLQPTLGSIAAAVLTGLFFIRIAHLQLRERAR